MEHHAAPAAADVEEAHPGLEVELAGHQLVLGRLGRLEADARVGPHAAGVRHRRAEHEGVEVVRDVVVVGDGLGVAGLGVAQAVQAGLLRGRGQRLQPAGAEDPGHVRDHAGVGLGQVVGDGGEGAEQVALEVEIAGHVGPAETELARCRHEALERLGATDDERGDGAGRGGLAPVEGADGDGHLRTEDPADQFSEPHALQYSTRSAARRAYGDDLVHEVVGPARRQVGQRRWR